MKSRILFLCSVFLFLFVNTVHADCEIPLRKKRKILTEVRAASHIIMFTGIAATAGGAYTAGISMLSASIPTEIVAFTLKKRYEFAYNIIDEAKSTPTPLKGELKKLSDKFNKKLKKMNSKIIVTPETLKPIVLEANAADVFCPTINVQQSEKKRILTKPVIANFLLDKILKNTSDKASIDDLFEEEKKYRKYDTYEIDELQM